MSPVLDQVRARLMVLLAGQPDPAGLLGAPVTVLARPLTPEEAIGTPGRRDFPIIVGKERVVEATVLGRRGHAFTDSPPELVGSLSEVLQLPLDRNQHRAIFVATMNALLCHLGRARTTVHCKDDDPERCSQDIAETLRRQLGAAEVGLVGLNPAIAERLVQTFGPDHVRITDLGRDNVGRERFGVQVWDGATQTEELVRRSDLLLVTGTTLVNGTFDRIHQLAAGKPLILYGVTAAAVCEMMGIERLCPRGQDG